MRLATCLLFCLSQATASAAWGWTLDNDTSRLSFVSIKAGDIAETHHFRHVSGSIENQTATLTIALASVDTLIPLRDERMQSLLFESGIFPNATVTVELDPATLADLQPGTVQAGSVTGKLTIRDRSVNLAAEISAVRSGDTLLVTTRQPILVSARAAGLSAGVERLREIAGLPSISDAVPVSFVLSFRQ